MPVHVHALVAAAVAAAVAVAVVALVVLAAATRAVRTRAQWPTTAAQWPTTADAPLGVSSAMSMSGRLATEPDKGLGSVSTKGETETRTMRGAGKRAGTGTGSGGDPSGEDDDGRTTAFDLDKAGDSTTGRFSCWKEVGHVEEVPEEIKSGFGQAQTSFDPCEWACTDSTRREERSGGGVLVLETETKSVRGHPTMPGLATPEANRKFTTSTVTLI